MGKKILLLITILFILSSILINVGNEIRKTTTIFSNENSLTYQKCLTNSFISLNTKQEVQQLFKEFPLNDYALYFWDIKNNFKIIKNENQKFYGASLIKLLEAIYLIQKKVDLSNTVTYQPKHKKMDSLKLQNYPYGSQLSLQTLIFYALSVSDNTAHEMLLDYIGISNLKQYAQSLGINLTINSYEHYGALSVKESFLILQETYKIIIANNKYSQLLYQAMNNQYYNSLTFNNLNMLHKYGLSQNYYHDIGIYLERDNQYLICIMTNQKYQPSPNFITEIHQRIYALYNQNNQDKQNFCQKKKEQKSF